MTVSHHRPAQVPASAPFFFTALRRLLAGICVALFAFQAMAAPQSGTADLPDFGDASGALMSPQEEERLGEAFMRMVRRDAVIIDDPEVEEYIQSLGYRLMAGADARDRHFTFFVVRNPAINAFAGPGGYIGVNSGLIAAAESESELASVLAHEIAHVTQRHLLRAFDKSNRLSLPITAALIAAILLAGKEDPQAGQAAIATTIAGSQQMQINFTRANELEADRVGLGILANAGYDPRAMPAFFEQLLKASRFYEGGLPEFLRTHPVTVSRVADTLNRAEQYPRREPPSGTAFQLIRAKLTVLTSDNASELAAQFAETPGGEQRGHEDSARYGLALALLAAGKPDEARDALQPLLKKDPERIPYLIARARIAAASGKQDDALKIYGDALTLYPHSYPLTLLYADALLQDGQAVKARQLLQEYLRYRDPKPMFYHLLARADNDAGFPIESQQALAEYAYLSGQTSAAIDHLNRALRMTSEDDFYRASRIEARLKELKRELDMEKEKAR